MWACLHSLSLTIGKNTQNDSTFGVEYVFQPYCDAMKRAPLVAREAIQSSSLLKNLLRLC